MICHDDIIDYDEYQPEDMELSESIKIQIKKIRRKGKDEDRN